MPWFDTQVVCDRTSTACAGFWWARIPGRVRVYSNHSRCVEIGPPCSGHPSRPIAGIARARHPSYPSRVGARLYHRHHLISSHPISSHLQARSATTSPSRSRSSSRSHSPHPTPLHPLSVSRLQHQHQPPQPPAMTRMRMRPSCPRFAPDSVGVEVVVEEEEERSGAVRACVWVWTWVRREGFETARKRVDGVSRLPSTRS